METATDRLAVVEREPGDAAEQREVREVVRARGDLSPTQITVYRLCE